MLQINNPAMGTALVRTAQPGGQLGRAVLMLGSTLCDFWAVAFLLLAEVKAISFVFFLFQAEDGIRVHCVTGVQTCALPISAAGRVLPPGLAGPPGSRRPLSAAARSTAGQTLAPPGPARRGGGWGWTGWALPMSLPVPASRPTRCQS